MKTTTVALNLPLGDLKEMVGLYASMIADKARMIDHTGPDYLEQIEQFERLSHDFIELHKVLVQVIAEESRNVPTLVASTPKE